MEHFDQLFHRIYLCGFHTVYFFYTMMQKKKKKKSQMWPKSQVKGWGAQSWEVDKFADVTFFSRFLL